MSVLVKPGKWECPHKWSYQVDSNVQLCAICGRVEIPSP